VCFGSKDCRLAKRLAPPRIATYFQKMNRQGVQFFQPVLQLWLLMTMPRLVFSAALTAVPAQLQPVTNHYHTVAVVDNYQWLEDAAAPAVREWTRGQNQRTRAYFDQLPFRDGIAQQLTQIRGEESARYFGLREKKGRIFAFRFKPPAQQPVLGRLSSVYPPTL